MADLSSRKESVGFVGAGNMASALIRGLVRSGFPATQIIAKDTDPSKTRSLSQELGIIAVDNAAKLAQDCDIVVLALKPGVTAEVARGFRAVSGDTLWISVAAGVKTSTLEEALGDGARVVRAMPNTPALIGQGATGVCAGTNATDADLDLARELLAAAGSSVVVQESMMDAVTGLSGSGPAFVMMVIEAMTDGAVRAGLPRPLAQELAAQTVKGAAAMLQETGKHPGELKDMVTSPAGTTIAGVEALEAAGLRNAMISAVTAAAARSRELSGD